MLRHELGRTKLADLWLEQTIVNKWVYELSSLRQLLPICSNIDPTESVKILRYMSCVIDLFGCLFRGHRQRIYFCLFSSLSLAH